MNRILVELSVELWTESNRSYLDIAREFAAWMERELAGIDSSTDCTLRGVEVVRARDGGEVAEDENQRARIRSERVADAAYAASVGK